ncbi:MAG: hypothetical protein QXD42_04010 [Nitrososphaerales archaeon]
MAKESCPKCGEKGFKFMKPVKSRGKAYSYLYYGHYDADKYQRNGGNKSHIRWCYIGKRDQSKEKDEDG